MLTPSPSLSRVVALAMVFATSSAGRLASQDLQLPQALETWCSDCHGGGGDLEGELHLRDLLDIEPSDADGIARLKLAAQRVRGRTMPPPDEAVVPDDAERAELLDALAQLAPHVEDARVSTMRRLTRRQYEATVASLFGIEWQARGLLPEGASAHGFDGIGDVQNTSPLMFEKLLDAALDVASTVLTDDAARRRVFGDGGLQGAGLESAVRNLLPRAYRRPATEAEVTALVEDAERLRVAGTPEEDVRRALLCSVLMSPDFLFRPEVGQSQAPWQLSPHELATRLSYALTSGPPDEELWGHADDGSLRTNEVLVAEALRLARQRDGMGLAEDFASQWLSLDDVLTQTADFRRFPQIWNGALRPSMREEAVRQFAYLVAEDRSVLELIDADYTFANSVLAKHYGLPKVKGRKMRRVELSDRRRGGILGSAAMLMATSFPLRTSPVKRGQWVLARLLDAPPPPPPADAGVLPRDDKHSAGLTLRQQLERHREDPGCAACHAEMDVLGFALENWDPIGRWRDAVHDQPIDTEGTLPDGTVLDGPVALKDALLQRSNDVVRAFAKNLLTFSVGREFGLRDEPELAKIVAFVRAREDRFSALLEAVVTSPLFTMRDPDHTP